MTRLSDLARAKATEQPASEPTVAATEPAPEVGAAEQPAVEAAVQDAVAEPATESQSRPHTLPDTGSKPHEVLHRYVERLR